MDRWNNMPAKLSAIPALKRPRFLSFLWLGMLVFALTEVNEAQAAITYQSAGAIAYSAAGGTSVAPGYPASIVEGDLLVLIIGMKPSTANSGSVTTPTGWTAITSLTGAGGYGTTLGADTGNTNIFTFFRVAAGGETGTLAVTIGTNNVSWAQMYRLSNATGGWSVAGTTGSDTTAGNVSIAMSADPGVTAGDFILGGMVIPTDVTTPAQFSAQALSQTGITFGTVTEISEPDSTTGNDIGGFTYSAPVSSGTASAAPTLTATAGGTVTNVRGPGVFIRAREIPNTIIADGTNPGNSTIAPGAAITDLDAFTLRTPTGTDSVTALTVTLTGTNSFESLSEVRITSSDGATLYFAAAANPASNTVSFSGGTPIPVTNTATTFKVRITPKTHANMPPPPGLSYAVGGTVTAFTSTNAQRGTDSASATVTVDNLSPGNVTAASGTAGNGQVVFTWTNPVSPAETVAYSIVVLRSTAGPVADTPVEGTTYVIGNTVGASEVRCVVTGLPPALTCTDTGLTNGTAYHYRIFTRDSNGNFSTPGVVPTGSPFTPAANCYAVNPLAANWNVATTWASTSGGVAGTCAGLLGIPGASEAVFIGETATARTVTIPAGYAASVVSVTIGTTAGVGTTGSSLVLAGTTSSLTTTGSVTVNRPAGAATNALTIGANTVTAGGNVTLGGTNTTNTFIASITLSTGTLNIAGNLVFITGNVASNLLTITGAGTVNLAGAFTATVGALTGTTSTFNFNGAVAQTIPINVSNIIYNHLHVNNTSANGATLSAAISATNVTGNLRVQSGILNNGGFAIAGGVSPDVFQVASGARFNLTGTSAMATGFGGGRTFGATSTVSYQGGNQAIASGLTYGHLILDGGTSTKTPAAGTITVAGNFTIQGTATTYAGNSNNPIVNLARDFSNGGTFNSGTGVFTFNGTAAGQAISGNPTTFSYLAITNTHLSGVTANTDLTISGNGPTACFDKQGVFNPGTSTVTFNGTAEQLFTAATPTSFYKLKIQNTGTTAPSGVTIDLDVTVTNQLDLASGVINTPTASASLAIGVIIPSTGSVTRTNGHVAGNLTKYFSVGSNIDGTYELGDFGNLYNNPTYAPLIVTFDSVSAAGSLRAYSLRPDHPDISTSSLDDANSANRYWGLQNPRTGSPPTFTAYSVSVTFANGSPVDLDPTVDAATEIPQFILERRVTVNEWQSLNVTSALNASPLPSQGTVAGSGATAIGEFATGMDKNPEYLREQQFIYTSERP